MILRCRLLWKWNDCKRSRYWTGTFLSCFCKGSVVWLESSTDSTPRQKRRQWNEWDWMIWFHSFNASSTQCNANSITSSADISHSSLFGFQNPDLSLLRYLDLMLDYLILHPGVFSPTHFLWQVSYCCGDTYSSGHKECKWAIIFNCTFRTAIFSVSSWWRRYRWLVLVVDKGRGVKSTLLASSTRTAAWLCL